GKPAGGVPLRGRGLQPEARGGPRRAERLPHGPGAADEGGRRGGPHARVHVRGDLARAGELVEGGRRGHRGADDASLRRDSGPRSPTRPGAAPGAARPVAAEAMAAPVLLGGVPASGRPGPTSRTLTRHEHMSLGNARCRAVRMAWMAAAWLTVAPGRLAAQSP